MPTVLCAWVTRNRFISYLSSFLFQRVYFSSFIHRTIGCEQQSHSLAACIQVTHAISSVKQSSPFCSARNTHTHTQTTTSRQFKELIWHIWNKWRIYCVIVIPVCLRLIRTGSSEAWRKIEWKKGETKNNNNLLVICRAVARDTSRTHFAGDKTKRMKKIRHFATWCTGCVYTRVDWSVEHIRLCTSRRKIYGHRVKINSLFIFFHFFCLFRCELTGRDIALVRYRCCSPQTAAQRNSSIRFWNNEIKSFRFHRSIDRRVRTIARIRILLITSRFTSSICRAFLWNCTKKNRRMCVSRSRNSIDSQCRKRTKNRCIDATASQHVLVESCRFTCRALAYIISKAHARAHKNKTNKVVNAILRLCLFCFTILRM